ADTLNIDIICFDSLFVRVYHIYGGITILSFERIPVLDSSRKRNLLSDLPEYQAQGFTRLAQNVNSKNLSFVRVKLFSLCLV
ncbi:MAG: hypothetical protein ACUZ9M_10520, partial [Candidatus Scalindua sp.]